MKKAMPLALATMLLASPSYAVCYGAVAVSVLDHKTGAVWGAALQADAERQALTECRLNGGKECLIVSRERKARCRQTALHPSYRVGHRSAARRPDHHRMRIWIPPCCECP